MAIAPRSGMIHPVALENESTLRIPAPTVGERRVVRILVALGLVSMVFFVNWFAQRDHIGNLPLYFLLTFALAFRLVRLLHEWYHYLGMTVPEAPPVMHAWTVDMITTFCPGEPYDMIEETLKAMKAVRYPHETYLCDEGNDPYIKQLCEDLGVHHVYRGPVKTNAKAGNVNHCLEQYARGEIAVILDPDHQPVPEFIDRVIPYFENPEIGYVQSIQGYSNQNESLVAKGAAEQTYHFYGPMMMSMNAYGTAQAIGANCAFRRAALDAIGGHAPGLSEDMHTAMQLHARGWKSVYIPELLTRGLVPATISAYYKQQLKWSRGTFSLLFTVFPKLVRRFTWRQRLHYFTIPLYFLYGLIALIDITVPVASLVAARVPWQVNLMEFALAVTPLLVLSMLIRQYAQRWLLEEQERGFHMMGGILMAGAWWVFLLGFVYSLLRIKVPYIPTPKDNEPTDEWGVSLPNLVVAAASVGAVIYGLSIDWNPYSFGMAFFALFNAGIMGFVGFLGLQATIQKARNQFVAIRRVERSKLRSTWWYFRHKFVYGMLRNSSLVLAVLAMLTVGGFTFARYEIQRRAADYRPPLQKNTGVFYAGVATAPENWPRLSSFFPDQTIPSGLNLVAIPARPYHESLLSLPDSLPRQVLAAGRIPVIRWQPFRALFNPSLTDSLSPEVFFRTWEPYLEACAQKIQALNGPVFIQFAPEPDNPGRGWGPRDTLDARTYRAVWSYVQDYFKSQGLSNIAWVWTPGNPDAVSRYYPFTGRHEADWIALPTRSADPLNYDWYPAWRETLHKMKEAAHKPVMILNQTALRKAPYQSQVQQAIRQLQRQHPEMQGVVLHLEAPQGSPTLTWGFSDRMGPAEAVALANIQLQNRRQPDKAPGAFPPRLNGRVQINRDSGRFALAVSGKPLFIKGVVYNLGSNWRDGDYPLTRERLVRDFSRIKNMGGNAIRRYKPGIYDLNLLRIAEEMEIHVVYGFWFDPNIDYHTDSARVNAYRSKVMKYVRKYKDFPAVIAWNLGSGVYHNLREYFGQPYLWQVRQSYLDMIGQLAREIHEIDPDRPVFTSLEDSRDAVEAVLALKDKAPSINAIGFNTFFEDQTSRLPEIMATYLPATPYFLSEFGPQGHAEAELTNRSEGYLAEASPYERARQYLHNWQEHVAKREGLLLGGFAYCWQDRIYGTGVWYGLTDYQGRFKPAYYTLQKEWTGQARPMPMRNLEIMHPPTLLRPGNEYTFSAITANPSEKEGYLYQWRLCRENSLEPIGSLRKENRGKHIKLTTPISPGSYRLYLHVSDGKGNSVATSSPLKIDWPR